MTTSNSEHEASGSTHTSAMKGHSKDTANNSLVSHSLNCKQCAPCCRALIDSGVQADNVNYVNAHGTSTPVGDMAEYRAIRNALPGDNLRINSTKSLIGHLLGAAGAVEAVAVIQAMQTGHHTALHTYNLRCMSSLARQVSS